MSVFPEQEDVRDKATSNPVLVMFDEDTGNRYMRLVGQKGLGEEREMRWLVHDMHEELKSWGAQAVTQAASLSRATQSVPWWQYAKH